MNIIMVLIFLLVGIIVGVLLRPWFGNEVIKLIPREHRFVDLGIEEETACSITCKNKKGMPPQRFYKHQPGYTGIVGMILKKPITRFFGKEGTAYTWSIGTDSKPIKVPIVEALKVMLSKEFYDQIPLKQQEILNNSKLDIIVDIDEGLTPNDEDNTPYRSISEEDIKREEDREAAKTFWKGKTSAERTQIISLLITGIAGFGIACALEILGILRISTPPPVVIYPPSNSTATTAFSIVVTAVRLLLGV